MWLVTALAGLYWELTVHSEPPRRPIPLLHVDDNENDRFLVKQAILLAQVPFASYEANGMQTAIPYFDFPSNEPHPPRPELLLLDYDLGDHTGCDFLYWMKAMKRIDSMPVVMFSGSEGTRHVIECYDCGANYFLRKPTSLERFKTIVRALYETLTHLEEPRAICFLDEFVPNPLRKL